MNECSLTLSAEELFKAALTLARDLRRHSRRLRRCRECQGYYCPALLEQCARIEQALEAIQAAWSTPEDDG